MSISQLAKAIDAYDPYHISFWNGIRAISALLGLLTVNFIYGVKNPYFYFFYIPITCLSIELLGETPKEKATLYFISVTWSALAVLVFGLCATHRSLELISIFGFSLFVYSFFIHNYKHALVSAATVLSLGGYSLNYHFANVDIYRAIYHFGLTLFGGLIVLGILYFFPQRVYWIIWQRILHKNLKAGLDFLSSSSPRQECMSLFQSFATQLQYARMINKHAKTLFKTSLMSHELLEALVVQQIYTKWTEQELSSLKQNLQTLISALDAKHPCSLEELSNQGPLEHQIFKLASEWNKLCEIYFSTP